MLGVKRITTWPFSGVSDRVTAPKATSHTQECVEPFRGVHISSGRFFFSITLAFLRPPGSIFSISKTQRTCLIYVALQRRRWVLSAEILTSDSCDPRTRSAFISPTLRDYHFGILSTLSGECVLRCNQKKNPRTWFVSGGLNFVNDVDYLWTESASIQPPHGLQVKRSE